MKVSIFETDPGCLKCLLTNLEGKNLFLEQGIYYLVYMEWNSISKPLTLKDVLRTTDSVSPWVWECANHLKRVCKVSFQDQIIKKIKVHSPPHKYKKQTKHIRRVECLYQIDKFLTYLKLSLKYFLKILPWFCSSKFKEKNSHITIS